MQNTVKSPQTTILDDIPHPLCPCERLDIQHSVAGNLEGLFGFLLYTLAL